MAARSDQHDIVLGACYGDVENPQLLVAGGRLNLIGREAVEGRRVVDHPLGIDDPQTDSRLSLEDHSAGAIPEVETSAQPGHEDHDSNRPREVGVEFHKLMDAYLTYLPASQQARDPDELIRLAVNGDPNYQPELVHCAHLTAPRIGLWSNQYISH